MLLHIERLFSVDEIQRIQAALLATDWLDGRHTAGFQSAAAKRNRQLAQDHLLAKEIGTALAERLWQHPSFVSAALPHSLFPPLVNRYGVGEAFDFHVDNAIRRIPGEQSPLRTDLSATLFLSHPEDYDGGELIIQDTYGTHQVKLPAGDLVLYPSSSLHRVEAVTRGERLASFMWIQSLVRDDGQRTLLYELDQNIQQLTHDVPDHPALVGLTGHYHNLLRRWANV